MHFDELMDSLGCGVVQRVTLLCCSLLAFVEGFLSAGILYLIPQLVCDVGIPPDHLVKCYVPFLTGFCVGSMLTWTDVIGRRSSLCLSATICFCSALFASAAPLVLIFELATFVSGLSVAGISSGCRLLLFETLTMQARGWFMPYIDLLTNLGIFAAIGLADFAIRVPVRGENLLAFTVLSPPWRVHLLLCGLLTLPGAVLAGLAPFSPRQMFAHQRVVTANSVMRRFYSANQMDHESNFLSNTGFPPDTFTYVETRHLRRSSGYMFFMLTCIASYIVDMFRCPFTIGTIAIIAVNASLLDGTVVLSALLCEYLRVGRDVTLTPGRAMTTAEAGEICLHQRSVPLPYTWNMYVALVVIIATLTIPIVAYRIPRSIAISIGCSLMGASSVLLSFNLGTAFDVAAVCVFMFSHTIALISLNIATLEHFPTKFRGTGFGVIKTITRLLLVTLLFVHDVSSFKLFSALPYAYFCAALLSILIFNKNERPILE